MAERLGAARVLAAVVGAALLCVPPLVFPLLLFALVLSIAPPDPFAPTGDPCCDTPNTWGDVIGDAVAAVVYGGILTALFCAGLVLVRWASRQPRWRLSRLALAPLTVATVMAIGLTAALLPIADDGRTPPDCATFAFREDRWRSSGDEPFFTTAMGLAECGTLEGRTAGEVQRLLGEPESAEDRYLNYDGLAVFLIDGRVDRAEAGYDAFD